MALPGATTLLHYMLVRFGRLVEGLVVRPERMAENIERGLGLLDQCQHHQIARLGLEGLAHLLVDRALLFAEEAQAGIQILCKP